MATVDHSSLDVLSFHSSLTFIPKDFLQFMFTLD